MMGYLDRLEWIYLLKTCSILIKRRSGKVGRCFCHIKTSTATQRVSIIIHYKCPRTELGPLDPDWFETLTSQMFTEDNVSDQEDLCGNQEANFKTPFDKTAVDSQLLSTPKVFRHSRVVSPETEDERSFTGEQGPV